MSHPTQARQTRAIGPIGTVSRLAAGLLLIGFPIVTHGIQAWDLAGALIVFPALSWGLYSLVSAVSQRSTRVNRLDETARSWFTNVSVLVLFLVIAIAATYVTPIDAGAIWLRSFDARRRRPWRCGMRGARDRQRACRTSRRRRVRRLRAPGLARHPTPDRRTGSVMRLCPSRGGSLVDGAR